MSFKTISVMCTKQVTDMSCDFLILLEKYFLLNPEAIFLVVCNPSMNEL